MLCLSFGFAFGALLLADWMLNVRSCISAWTNRRWLRKGINVMWHSSDNEFFYFKDCTVSIFLERDARDVRAQTLAS